MGDSRIPAHQAGKPGQKLRKQRGVVASDEGRHGNAGRRCHIAGGLAIVGGPEQERAEPATIEAGRKPPEGLGRPELRRPEGCAQMQAHDAGA